MSKAYERVSSVALTRADQFSEKAIFWSLVSTVLVIGMAMLKTVPGL